MTDRELMQQALLQIQNHADVSVDEWIAVEKALRERLAQPDVDPCKDGSCDCCWTDKPEQEPVAWQTQKTYDKDGVLIDRQMKRGPNCEWEPWLTPPRREWVGLTGEELDLIARIADDLYDAALKSQAKLKEKNT